MVSHGNVETSLPVYILHFKMFAFHLHKAYIRLRYVVWGHVVHGCVRLPLIRHWVSVSRVIGR